MKNTKDLFDRLKTLHGISGDVIIGIDPKNDNIFVSEIMDIRPFTCKPLNILLRDNVQNIIDNLNNSTCMSHVEDALLCAILQRMIEQLSVDIITTASWVDIIDMDIKPIRVLKHTEGGHYDTHYID